MMLTHRQLPAHRQTCSSTATMDPCCALVCSNMRQLQHNDDYVLLIMRRDIACQIQPAQEFDPAFHSRRK